MDRWVHVYKSNGAVVITSVIRTTTGAGLDVDPIVLGRGPDTLVVSDALSRALENSVRIVSHPAQDEWKSLITPLPKAVGVRSQKAFMKDAQTVSVRVLHERLLTAHTYSFRERG